MLRRSVVLLVSVLALLVGLAVPVAADQAGPRYYVALGDSLSQGYQPGQGDTDEGYVDVLHATLAAQEPGLELVKLGCSGETAASMVRGGRCTYDGAASQLEAAADFLREHRGEVAYVTLDIGANDLLRCVSGLEIDRACAYEQLGSIGRDLRTILSTLREAGGRGEGAPTYAGMTYYDPVLATWLLGEAGQATARESVVLTNLLNGLESILYAVHGFRVAPVAKAFETNDFSLTSTLPGVGIVPVNVFRICTLTYACVAADIHANPAGYRLIAETFAGVLSERR